MKTFRFGFFGSKEKICSCIGSKMYIQCAKNANGYPVHIVGSNNVHNYNKLEQRILDKVKSKAISLTHLSDIIRMNLLAEHGGF